MTATLRRLALVLVAGCAPRGGPSSEVAPPAPVAPAAPAAPTPARPYDPATETRVDGKVMAVRAEIRPGGRSEGIHVDLESPVARFDVHLGPRFFLDEIGLHPAIGDDLRVVGSRQPGEPPVIIARTVTRGETTWELRDAQGRPLWRGGR